MNALPAGFRPPLLHPAARVALYFVAFLLVQIPVGIIFVVLAVALGQTDPAQLISALSGDMMLGLTAVAFAFVIPITVLFCVLLDRRPFHTIGVAPSQSGLKQFALGLALGAGMVWLNVGLLALLGHVESSRLAEKTAWPLLSLYAIGFFIQSGGEELVSRGYIMQNLLTWWGTGWALAAQAIMFAVLHGSNPGGMSGMTMVNLLLFATASGLAYLRLGNLWLPIGVHTGWNFCLANIAGLTVSGITLSTRVFETKLAGEVLWTGGEFGLEASVVNTLVWSVFCAVFALMRPRYAQQVWWERVRRFVQYGTVVVERQSLIADEPDAQVTENRSDDRVP